MQRQRFTSSNPMLDPTPQDPEIYVMVSQALLSNLTPQELQKMAELYQVAYERACRKSKTFQQPDPFDDLGLGI